MMSIENVLLVLAVVASCPLVGYAMRSQRKWALTRNDEGWIAWWSSDFRKTNSESDYFTRIWLGRVESFVRADAAMNPALVPRLREAGLVRAGWECDERHRRLWRGTDGGTLFVIASSCLLSLVVSLAVGPLAGLMISMVGASCVEIVLGDEGHDAHVRLVNPLVALIFLGICGWSAYALVPLAIMLTLDDFSSRSRATDFSGGPMAIAPLAVAIAASMLCG